MQQKYEETIQKLVHALFLSIQLGRFSHEPWRAIAEAILQTSHKYSTSLRFEVELSICFVDFELQ